MKKIKFLLPLLLSSCLLVGCGEQGLPHPSGDGSITSSWVDFNIPMTELNFDSSEQSICLYKGETHDYSFTYAPDNATLTQLKWESTNPEIANVEDGKVTALERGSTTIKVSSEAEVPWTPKTLEVEVKTKLESFDIEEASLDLDYNEEYQLHTSFTPIDASDTSLKWSSDDPTIATVIDGKVTAKLNDGTCTITATSNQLPGYEKQVTVKVSDKTIHVDTIEVSLEQNSVEIGETTKANAIVTPTDAKEYLEHGVTFSTTTPEYIDIDSKTGVITAKEPGIAKIKAICEGVESDETVLEVYEVIPTGIVLINSTGAIISGSTIELDNDLSKEHSSYQLSYKYLNSDSEEIIPSRPNATYHVSDENVVTINESGLVTLRNSGTTVVTINDSQYGVTSQVTFNVTIYALSVTLQTEGSVLGIGHTMVLRNSILPSNVTDASVTYSIDSTEYATLNQESGSLTATLEGIAKGDVVVTVTTSNGLTDSKTISVEKIPGAFKEGTPYVVGNANFSSGKSTGSESSWDDADLAFEFVEDVPSPLYSVQKHAQIIFRANDQWKVRVGSTYPENSQYERTEGNAFDAGKLAFDEATTNIKVLEAGLYDIYYKVYKDSGTEAIYIKKAVSLSIDKTLLYLTPSESDSITATNVHGELNVTKNNENISFTQTDNVINVTGVNPGTSVITISDDLDSLTCNVTVTETPVTTHKVTYNLPDATDATKTAFISEEIEVAEDENLYDSLSGFTGDIAGFTFNGWYSTNSHFRTDDPENDVVENTTLVTEDTTVFAKYVKENNLYYFHSKDEKGYYVESSHDEYGIYASSVFYGTHIYSLDGVEGHEIKLGTNSGVYKLTKNETDWTILRKVSFGINDVSSWWAVGAHCHIYCFGEGVNKWVENITFSNNLYTGFFELKYTSFILTRSNSSTPGWDDLWNQTVDIGLTVAGYSNPEVYSAEHTTAFVQDVKTEGSSGKNYYNWW